MHPTQSKRYQQQRLQHHQGRGDSYRFFNLLTSDALLDKVEELLPEHRERLYPPTETLSMFLAQAMSADRSCQHAVNQAAVQRLAGGLATPSVRTGGYCRARQRLPLEMVRNLGCYLGEHIHLNNPKPWRWQGRAVKLVDGTTMTLPDTPENQGAFPQPRGQQPGLGFPVCRMVGVTCLASGALLNAALGRFNGKGGDERTLLRTLEYSFVSGDIVLGDAYFATYFFIAAMQARGVDILMEQHGSRRQTSDFRRGQKLGSRDHLIQFFKPKTRPNWMAEDDYLAAPEALTVRELKAGGKLMITTLTDARTYSKVQIKHLYKSRWNIELDLRDIKQTLGMDRLSCQSPAMVEKEIWVYLLAYNLIRLMMAQSALLADISPRRISFKHCLQLWQLGLRQLDLSDDEQLFEWLRLIAQQRVGNRPGRIEPRALKRRPRAFPLLMIPRDKAKAIIAKTGHPKKLK